jgi:hypothetical protein
MSFPDRLQALRSQNKVTGIDFIYVYGNQTTLDIYFLASNVTLPLAGLVASAVTIHSPSGGESLADVPVNSIQWVQVNGRDVLRAQTAQPGDFSRYRLHIEDARIDRFYNDVIFSFKANCRSELDCKSAAHECAPEPPVDFPVDYTARDFWSFRRALLDFASQRYPQWQDRLEADVGNMLAELMSALGDEFAYNQDRIAREAYFETATERRSLRRHAALVDYHIHDGLGATTWLDFQVTGDTDIPSGTEVTDSSGLIKFEIGNGMEDLFPEANPIVVPSYSVKFARNNLTPHVWDSHQLCLPAGSTELYVGRSPGAALDQPSGQSVLLITKLVDPSVKGRAWIVQLTEAEDTVDQVLGQDITRLKWDAAQATPFELDLTILQVHANLVPATAGTTRTARFSTHPQIDDPDHPAAVERHGPDSSPAYLFSLPESDSRNLVFLGISPSDAKPEMRVKELAPSGDIPWQWRRELLGANSAQPEDRQYRLDDGFWRRVAGYQRAVVELVHQDYATGMGRTIRFGDGEFGRIPPDDAIFEVTYRLGGGASGNVAAGTLTQCSVAGVTVTNPIPASGGVDPETAEEVRQTAPDAFRALTYRAVRSEDYAEAVERLDWVQRAGASFRWTGSWLTAVVAPDPRGAFALSAAQRVDGTAQLERFRQAGRPVLLLDPIYANLDLVIVVCVEGSAYRGEVLERVLEALFGVPGVRPRPGFFSPDNFTFGTTLDRSRLEAAIQKVDGVRAVEDISIRRRGWFNWRPLSIIGYQSAPNEVIRVQNDPAFPERGSVNLRMQGGI